MDVTGIYLTCVKLTCLYPANKVHGGYVELTVRYFSLSIDLLHSISGYSVAQTTFSTVF